MLDRVYVLMRLALEAMSTGSHGQKWSCAGHLACLGEDKDLVRGDLVSLVGTQYGAAEETKLQFHGE